MKCCEMEPCKVNEHIPFKAHPKLSGTAVVLAGITALVVALLAITSVITLPAIATFGLALVGGALLFAASFLCVTESDKDSKLLKVAIVIVQLIAISAIVCGALGLSGHLPFLRGNLGTLTIGGGLILLMGNCVPYCLKYPYQIIV